MALAACHSRDAGPSAFPRAGIAVSDTAGAWCAAFAIDSAAPPVLAGRHLTIVFVGAAAVAATPARVRGAHAGECPAAFPQSRWASYAAYDLDLLDTPGDTAQLPSVALVVASDTRWSRGADGIVRADLDGDGQPEEARRCTADEGEHLTLWSRQADGRRMRRWHEYYDWGAFTDPTCQPGEDGEGPSLVAALHIAARIRALRRVRA